MKSNVLIAGMITILSLSILVFTGRLQADEGSESKGCPEHGEKMEEMCNKEMCAKMEAHRATMNAASEKMGEHLIAMKEITNDKKWREEMEVHMGMIQAYLEQMANCPMGSMMHKMMHGEKGENGGKHHEGSESK